MCAKHSATFMAVFQGGSSCLGTGCDHNQGGNGWNFGLSANNHGRDYTQLGYDCSSWNGWFYTSGWNEISGSNAGNATGSWDGWGGCQSSYSWSSNNNAHLCNDDAAYELWQAKSGSMYTSYGDQTGFWWGTGQGASGWGSSWTSLGDYSCSYPSGDWNTPNCP
jgi:hypothetical protein